MSNKHLLHCFRSQNYFYTAWGESYRDAANRLNQAGKIHPTLKKTFGVYCAYEGGGPCVPINEHLKMMEGDVAYGLAWGGQTKLNYWRKYNAFVASRPDILTQFLQGKG
jgi:hypothetical protein